MNLPTILPPLLAYFIGAIPTALLVSKCKGLDIRKLGSGNVGATNVFRNMGKGWGTLTLVADILKGFLPIRLFPLIFPESAYIDTQPYLILIGFCAILGHNWPIYLKFKGGKGVATTLGVILGLAPELILIGLAVFLTTFIVTRYISAASMIGAITVAACAWIFRAPGDLWIPVSFSILAFMIIIRHRANIQRLIKGEENRSTFSFMKK